MTTDSQRAPPVVRVALEIRLTPYEHVAATRKHLSSTSRNDTMDRYVLRTTSEDASIARAMCF